MLPEFPGTATSDTEMATQRSADAKTVCTLMSGWKPDETLQLEAVHRFPVLEISPDAVEFFARSGHFSVRDLRFLVTEFGFQVDFRDTPGVYREVLLRAQEAPWVLPVLEVAVGGNRSGQRSSGPGKLPLVLSKLPLSKLRLKSHPDFHERLFQLHDSPAPVDLAVAAFCEYALASYEYRVRADGLRSVTEAAVALLKEASLSMPQEHNPSPSSDAISLLEHRGKQDFQPSAELMQQLVNTLQRLASNLDTEAGADNFKLISELADLGMEIAEHLPAQRHETLFAQLQTFGIPHSTDTVSEDGLAAFAELLDLGLADSLVRMTSAAGALEQMVFDLREKINVATQEDDFATVASVAPEANKAKSNLSDQTAARDRVFELLAVLISNGCEDVPAVSRELVGLLEQTPVTIAIPDTAVSEVSVDDEHAPPGDEDEAIAGAPDEEADIDLMEPAQEDEAAEGPLETKSARSWHPEVDYVTTAANDEQEPAPELAALPSTVTSQTLVDLLGRDLIGIAADVAETLEGQGASWDISAVALKAGAASRMARLDYGADTSKFEAIANRAIADDLDDLSSVLVLGALVRPAILSANLRNSLQGLCRGVLGQHLQQVAEAISNLDYAFPPSSDVLAQMFGSQRPPQRQRFVEQLNAWRAAFVRKTSRWPFATAFMHEVASEYGLVGKAINAINAGDGKALSLAKTAISELGSPSLIDAQSVNFANSTGRSVARLHAKGIDYLYRQFDEPRGLLMGWVGAVEGEKSHDQLSETRIRSTVGNLQSRLDRAVQGLVQEETSGLDILTQGVSAWIRRQLLEARKALDGADSGTFATLDEALSAERDLLPADVRDALESGENRFELLVAALNDDAVLAPDQALSRACGEAAFDTAYRLAERFKIDATEKIRESIATFTGHWAEEIERRQARMRSISKVDYKHQDTLARQLEWCSITLDRLAATGTGTEVHDLAEVPRQLASLDAVVGQIDANIRNDQRARISEYRNDRNFEEATELADALDHLTIEAVEDRIAQLRDGRSAASFETDLSGVIGEFAPEFLAFAGSSDWPRSYVAFAAQIERPGHLFVDEDRRPAGLSFVKIYHDIVASLAMRTPLGAAIKQLFEELNFENVKLHDLRPVGRTALWHGTLSGIIRSGRIDGLFVPPPSALRLPQDIDWS
ncbi:hypothetical protein [Devosia sp. A449]